MDESQLISEIKEQLERKIAEEIEDLGAPRGLYGPVRYAMESGGKRLRPILVISACHWAGGSVKDALDAAYAVELFHNFTLVHDDIMDRADLRRGQEAVFKQFGLNKALLAGDVMLTLAHRSMTRAAVHHDKIELIHCFDDMAVALCEGQQWDSDAEEVSEISVDEYLNIIEQKTAILLASCLQIGGLIGGANEQEVQTLYKYGLKTGMAFQIQDDYLDVFGDSERTGKIKGGDILMNKKTYLYLKALERSSEEDRQRLLTLFSQGHEERTGEKVESVHKLYEKYRVGQAALKLKERFLEESMECLEVLQENGHSVNLLKQLGKQLIYRSH